MNAFLLFSSIMTGSDDRREPACRCSGYALRPGFPSAARILGPQSNERLWKKGEPLER
jgi:hypothetical protein